MNTSQKYNDVLSMVYQLQESEVDRLIQDLQNEKSVKLQNVDNKANLQNLLLHSPVWSDEEYDTYIEARKDFNRWRE
jgi:tryptophan synthase alpha subunit